MIPPRPRPELCNPMQATLDALALMPEAFAAETDPPARQDDKRAQPERGATPYRDALR